MSNKNEAKASKPGQTVTLTIRLSQQTVARLEDLEELTGTKKTVIARNGILNHLLAEESKVHRIRERLLKRT